MTSYFVQENAKIKVSQNVKLCRKKWIIKSKISFTFVNKENVETTIYAVLLALNQRKC